MPDSNRALIPTLVRAALGSLVGAAVGYLSFVLVARQGALLLALPGALAGIGCGVVTRERSQAAGALAGVVALVLSIYIEWKFFPFAADESLGYFLTHLHQASGRTWIMIVGGTLAGDWFGCGRRRQGGEADSRDTE